LFSFTKPVDHWFAWEWGWDTTIAWIHSTWGLAGVAYVNVLLLCFVSALLFRLIRRTSGNDLLAFLLTIVAMCGSMIHWLARPHLVSWVFILIFCHVITSAEENNPKVIWCLPALTVVWTNLHGAFFVGVMLLCATTAEHLIRTVLRKTETDFEEFRRYSSCALACAAATLVNPYGWRLHEHVLRYLRDSKLLDNIQEFQTISFHHPSSIFFESMLVLGLMSVVWCLQSNRWSPALLVLVWAHLALVSGRNIPIYLFIAAPWIGYMLNNLLEASDLPASLSRAVRAFRDVMEDFQPLERIERWHFISACVIVYIALCLYGKKPGFDARFPSDKFPVKAVSVLQGTDFERVFTSDQWGDYLIYRLHAAKKVFMDGRSDFYGDDFVSMYQHTMSARYDWRTNLQRFGIDSVMVKPDVPLATVLKASSDWALIWDDGSANIFRRLTRSHSNSQAPVPPTRSAPQRPTKSLPPSSAPVSGKSVFV
jgi:hypothetical protein